MRTRVERFESKISYEPMSGCWLWIASRDAKGYGRFNVGPGVGTIGAHRFSWELANGRIPNGMCIDHRCHNPACVNPDHLRVCTPMQNLWNTKVHRDNQSGLKCAFYDKATNRWYSRIKAGKKYINLGRFDTAIEAHEAYCEAAVIYHKQFACFGGA